MKTQTLAVGFSLLSFFPLKAMAAELNFDQLYVFGDSLSDIGNIYNVTTTANLIQPGIIAVQPPSPPYYQGRYSNGPNWVDDLASSLGLTITPSTQLTVGLPVTPSLQFNSNYGGATARQSVDFAFGSAESGRNNASSPVLPGILTEVQSYTDDLKVVNQPAHPNALYIVWEGGLNDYRSGAYTRPDQLTANIVQAITSLYDVGARNVLVVNEPNLGEIPVVAASGASNANYLSQLSLATDAELLTQLNDLRPTLSDINLVDLDDNALFQSAIDAPTSFGLTNVTDACLVTTGTTFSICENPNSYLFWDDRHPTA
ncbi:MAG: SGNH/GDSL hydrolase family protein, partial [Chroococcidiopsidaceae cyanobacterium CP_BM_ER_R8_30]|nr:SGNH/GDSL hydrolase family protein [Chroococcidiopsidaceae cyanobacterium CP_BM_ER_R8_30]